MAKYYCHYLPNDLNPVVKYVKVRDTFPGDICITKAHSVHVELILSNNCFYSTIAIISRWDSRKFYFYLIHRVRNKWVLDYFPRRDHNIYRELSMSIMEFKLNPPAYIILSPNKWIFGKFRISPKPLIIGHLELVNIGWHDNTNLYQYHATGYYDLNSKMNLGDISLFRWNPDRLNSLIGNVPDRLPQNEAETFVKMITSTRRDLKEGLDIEYLEKFTLWVTGFSPVNPPSNSVYGTKFMTLQSVLNNLR